MSKVYALPIVNQEQKYNCWLIAPAIISCRNSSRDNFLLKYDEYGKKIKNKLLGSQHLLTFFSPGGPDKLLQRRINKGIEPADLIRTYKEIGIYPLDAELTEGISQIGSKEYDESNTLQKTQYQEKVAKKLELILNEYGPLVMVRKSLGEENSFHAVVIVGVVLQQDKIQIVIHDSSVGKELFYDLSDLREFLCEKQVIEKVTYCCCFIENKALPSLWYSINNKGKNNEIETKDLSEYNCIDADVKKDLEIHLLKIDL